MDLYGLLSNGLFWITCGVFLSAAEIILPGIYLLWVGFAAVITGFVGLLFIGDTYAELYLLFFCSSTFITIWLTHKYRSQLYGFNKIDTDNINQRSHKLIGKEFVLSEDIVNGCGKIKVDDSIWIVYGEPLEKGTKVLITSVDGVRIYCQKSS